MKTWFQSRSAADPDAADQSESEESEPASADVIISRIIRHIENLEHYNRVEVTTGSFVMETHVDALDFRGPVMQYLEEHLGKLDEKVKDEPRWAEALEYTKSRLDQILLVPSPRYLETGLPIFELVFELEKLLMVISPRSASGPGPMGNNNLPRNNKSSNTIFSLDEDIA
jgi:hypothetical protein